MEDNSSGKRLSSSANNNNNNDNNSFTNTAQPNNTTPSTNLDSNTNSGSAYGGSISKQGINVRTILLILYIEQ
jgi:hypothetical protein